MPKKSLSLLMVIMLLAASAMACATLTGKGGLSPADIAETAAADANADAAATIAAAEATAGIDNGDDNGDETPTEDAGDNGDNGDTDNPFDGQGPADIPVDNNNAELVLGDDTSLTYYTDSSFDDTVDFYRSAMIDSGWEATENGDVVFGGIAALQFSMNNKIAAVTVTDDPTSERSLVAIVVTEQ